MVSRTVLSSTPKRAKTTENPRTKKTLLRKILSLDGFCTDVPERYAKNPGIRGRTQGLKKEITPAKNAIMIVGSAIIVPKVVLI